MNCMSSASWYSNSALPILEIDRLIKQLVRSLSPLQIYLFGSYADGSFNEYSDFDFYIVVANETADFADLTAKAYRAIREIKQRPVDIIVNSKSHFENRSQIPSLESEVAHKGILLYSL